MADKAGKGMFKNSAVRMIAALVAVGVFSGITLVFVYNYAMPRIQANVEAETDRAIRNIFPGASRIESTREEDVSRVMDARGGLLGYAFTAEGNGYQGCIKLIAGVDAGLSGMKGMEVIESQETPGLGAEIAGGTFKEQFKGLSIVHPIEYVKNRKPQKPYQIEALTGATISSRAVVNILNRRIREIRGLLKGK